MGHELHAVWQLTWRKISKRIEKKKNDGEERKKEKEERKKVEKNK